MVQVKTNTPEGINAAINKFKLQVIKEGKLELFKSKQYFISKKKKNVK